MSSENRAEWHLGQEGDRVGERERVTLARQGRGKMGIGCLQESM